MFSKNTFPAVIQHHDSGTEGEIVTVFPATLRVGEDVKPHGGNVG